MNTASQTLQNLRERWPMAFTDPPRPLMRGIADQIAEHFRPRWAIGSDIWTTWSYRHTRAGRALCAALEIWTKSPDYLRACTAGAPRIDLDGRAVGVVTEAEAEWAAQELRRMNENRATAGPARNTQEKTK